MPVGLTDIGSPPLLYARPRRSRFPPTIGLFHEGRPRRSRDAGRGHCVRRYCRAACSVGAGAGVARVAATGLRTRNLPSSIAGPMTT